MPATRSASSPSNPASGRPAVRPGDRWWRRWPRLEAVLALSLLGVLAGAGAHQIVVSIDRLFPTASVAATVTDTDWYRTFGSNIGTGRVYEASGVTADGDEFTIESIDLYRATSTQVPVDGTARTARLSGAVVSFELDEVSYGADRPWLMRLLVGAAMIALATRAYPAATRRRGVLVGIVTGTGVRVALSAGLVVGVVLTLVAMRQSGFGT